MSCTESPSPASKSTSSKPTAKKQYWAHTRGLEAERSVIFYYQKQNYKLVRQRVQTPFAEVDLLFEPVAGPLLLVEVKSANNQDFYAYRISKKQKQRLLKAAAFMAERFKRLVAVHWAFVDSAGKVTVIDDVSSW